MDAARRRWFAPAAWRGVGLGVLWLVLAGPEGWVIGAVAVASATAISLGIGPPGPTPTLRGLVGFTPFFLWHSLRGGVDVGWRALGGRAEPGFETWTLRLPPDGREATFLVAIIGLLPGTLCAEVDGRCLTIHRLGEQPVGPRLDRLEERVARLFGARLEAR